MSLPFSQHHSFENTDDGICTMSALCALCVREKLSRMPCRRVLWRRSETQRPKLDKKKGKNSLLLHGRCRVDWTVNGKECHRTSDGYSSHATQPVALLRATLPVSSAACPRACRSIGTYKTVSQWEVFARFAKGILVGETQNLSLESQSWCGNRHKTWLMVPAPDHATSPQGWNCIEIGFYLFSKNFKFKNKFEISSKSFVQQQQCWIRQKRLSIGSFVNRGVNPGVPCQPLVRWPVDLFPRWKVYAATCRPWHCCGRTWDRLDLLVGFFVCVGHINLLEVDFWRWWNCC